MPEHPSMSALRLLSRQHCEDVQTPQLGICSWSPRAPPCTCTLAKQSCKGEDNSPASACPIDATINPQVWDACALGWALPAAAQASCRGAGRAPGASARRGRSSRSSAPGSQTSLASGPSGRWSAQGWCSCGCAPRPRDAAPACAAAPTTLSLRLQIPGSSAMQHSVAMCAHCFLDCIHEPAPTSCSSFAAPARNARCSPLLAIKAHPGRTSGICRYPELQLSIVWQNHWPAHNAPLN